MNSQIATKRLNTIDRIKNIILETKRNKLIYSRELDSESGFYYYRARYYSSEIGRFLQSDPHPGYLKQGNTVFNKYIYVVNNPIQNTDPTGMFFGWNPSSLVNSMAKRYMNFNDDLMDKYFGGENIFGAVVTSVLLGDVTGAGFVNNSGLFKNDFQRIYTKGIITGALVALGIKYLAGKELLFAAGGSLIGGLINDNGVEGYIDGTADSFGNTLIFKSFYNASNDPAWSVGVITASKLSSFLDLWIPAVEYTTGRDIKW